MNPFISAYITTPATPPNPNPYRDGHLYWAAIVILLALCLGLMGCAV